MKSTVSVSFSRLASLEVRSFPAVLLLVVVEAVAVVLQVMASPDVVVCKEMDNVVDSAVEEVVPVVALLVVEAVAVLPLHRDLKTV
jgi:ABC-type anion transport system duplicated permease subunit